MQDFSLDDLMAKRQKIKEEEQQLEAQINNFQKVQSIKRLLANLQEIDLAKDIEQAIATIVAAAAELAPQPAKRSGRGGRTDSGKPRLLYPVKKALKAHGPLSFGELMRTKEMTSYAEKTRTGEEKFHLALDEAVTAKKLTFSGNKYAL